MQNVIRQKLNGVRYKFANPHKCCASFKMAYSHRAFAYTILEQQLCISKRLYISKVSSMYLPSNTYPNFENPYILDNTLYIYIHIYI